MFECSKCGKKFSYFSDFTRHENRKTSCNLKRHKKGTKRHIKNDIFDPQISLKTTPKTTSQGVSCSYCFKVLANKSSVNRHILNACLKVPKAEKSRFIAKYNKNGNTKKENKLVSYKEKKELNSESMNNLKNKASFGMIKYIDLKNELDNNNFININNINNYDDDDYSHLTEDDILKICGSGSNTYVMLFKYLMKNKNNYNYLIKNKREDEILVVKNNKIKMTNMNVLSVYKFSRLSDIIIDIYDDNIRNKLDEKKREKLEELLIEELDYDYELNKIKRQLSTYNLKTKEIFNHINIAKYLNV